MKNPSAKKRKDIGTQIKCKKMFYCYQKGFTKMFTLLQNQKIPKTAIGIDSFFGHLKGNLNIHRGLIKNSKKKVYSMVSFL